MARYIGLWGFAQWNALLKYTDRSSVISDIIILCRNLPVSEHFGLLVSALAVITRDQFFHAELQFRAKEKQIQIKYKVCYFIDVNLNTGRGNCPCEIHP